MEGVVIHIDWPYFLGIIGALLGIAWYSSSRFTALETSMQWVIRRLDYIDEEEKISEFAPPGSPRQLNERGLKILNESGVRRFVDEKKDELLEKIRAQTFTNPYDAERYVLDTMRSAPKAYPEIIDDIKTAAFQAGTDVDSVLLVGGFYLRDLIFPELGFAVDGEGTTSPLLMD